ncbi:Nitrilase/cyanide hydratase and apolipoprotein N-acyltransferase [Pyrolobus fumarii 1A]|uniref:Nitrilase/cyanide hydratase and apolipoprotein N-acyltransferase n=1 Tax=Pyrolobus fumarii (strain DSM 11204 / 1A) TaxID=694429 RepID=G0EHE9_PYRF1|nr:carbon-nitrogen hydrolase family protein [Pyrolobus fumarii]AEM38524.1 Nitrilase/cyanide hydratase and apolipoprotein N-acyltransferase [Pyrolobus fumarii 1A]
MASDGKTLRIALLHMKLKLLVKRTNLDRARKLLREAVSRNSGGIHVAVLPAFVNIGAFYLYYPEARAKNIVKHQAERIPGPTTEYLSKVAIENGVYIIGGPIIERAGPRIFMTTFVLAPNGEIIYKYRKLVLNEREKSYGISSGREVVTLEQLPRRIGVMSEDDLLAPEVARSLVLQGSTAIVLTLSFSQPINLVKNLLLARSIENHVPILALGGIVEHATERKEVPTIIVDPEQGTIAEEHSGEEKPLIVEMRVDKALNPGTSTNNNDNMRMAELLCRVLRELKMSR